MKLRKIIVCLFIMALLAGCSSASYSMHGKHNEINIEVSADDGKYGGCFVMDIKKDQIVHIDSKLKEGALQIEFFEVVNTATADESDDYEIISTIKTVTVNPGDQLDVSLDGYKGDFMPGLTAIGKTSGELVISVIKQ